MLFLGFSLGAASEARRRPFPYPLKRIQNLKNEVIWKKEKNTRRLPPGKRLTVLYSNNKKRA